MIHGACSGNAQVRLKPFLLRMGRDSTTSAVEQQHRSTCMKMMSIGKSGVEASAIGLGAWAIVGDSNWGPSDDDESIRTVHRARELGITLVDTAPAYGLGHSEEVIGKALKGRRSDYVLATKCGV